MAFELACSLDEFREGEAVAAVIGDQEIAVAHDGDPLAVDGDQDGTRLGDRVDLESRLVAHWAAASRALGAPIEVSA